MSKADELKGPTMTTKASGYLLMGSSWKPGKWKEQIKGGFTNGVMYKVVEVARGTPAELAVLPDPDEPKIEVVRRGTCMYTVDCGDWSWDSRSNEWVKKNTPTRFFSTDLDARSLCFILRKHKDYPPTNEGDTK